MDIDSTLEYRQPNMLKVGEAALVFLDALPALWQAAEALAAPDLEARRSGFECILKMDAARISPLVAYLLGTRLTEPDLDLRARIIRVLADICDSNGLAAPVNESVRANLALFLSQMRTRQIFALLQAADHDSSLDEGVARMLNCCSFAGNQLSDILMDRQMPLAIRKKAVVFIERVGYVDALPALERAMARLESRSNGRQLSLWEMADEDDEASLFPLLENALRVLKAP